MNRHWKPQKSPFRVHKKLVYQKIVKTSDFIYQIGESPALRQESKPVRLKDIDSVIFREKLGYLKSCLLRYRRLTGMGRGISAVQVGIPEKFAVAYVLGNQYGLPADRNGILTIVNPKIIKRSKKLLKYPEICMSSAPIIAPVVRPSWVEVEYLDERGKKQIWEIKDEDKDGLIYNRAIQHEIDHMNGIINIDRVESKELIFESDPNFYEKANFEEVLQKK